MPEYYPSKRNRVRPAAPESAVIKEFADEASFQREWMVYKALRDSCVPCAKVLAAEGKTLTLSELPGKNLVDWLEQQEKNRIPLWDIWEKLADWLIAFWRHTGLVMTDVNLRNFLYDGQSETLYGLDFEQCDQGSIEVCAATVAAFIRTYRPAHTPLKEAVSAFVLERFADRCGLDRESLRRQSQAREEILLQRRKNK